MSSFPSLRFLSQSTPGSSILKLHAPNSHVLNSPFMAQKVCAGLSSRLHDSLTQSRALFTGEPLFWLNPKVGLCPARFQCTYPGFSRKFERLYRCARLLSPLRHPTPLFCASSFRRIQKPDSKLRVKVSASSPIGGDATFSTVSGENCVALFDLS